jgi:hypothetical protein
MKKLYIILIVLVFAGFGMLNLVRIGWYPIALVNSQLVWGSTVEKEYASALKYYSQMLSTYKGKEVSDQQIKKIKKEVKQATLDKIIEKMIIANNANELIGDEKSKLIEAKVKKYLQDPKLKAAASALFNLSFDDFKTIILIPQAERELLEEQFSSENRDFNNWLKNQKKKAKVYLFTKEYTWTDQGIKKK